MRAELFNFKCWVLESDPAVLKNYLSENLVACGFEVLGFMDHHFQPYGYTAIWLLGESHLALHTYPEEQRSYIELTSCILKKSEEFEQLLQQKWVLIDTAKA